MRLTSTSSAHLAFIGLIAAYLTWSYPAAGMALAIQLGLALVSEVMHRTWRGSDRWLVLREVFFLVGLTAAWLLRAPLYPMVGFALCASLLLLVRHRALRFFPALCAVDLVWCGVGGTPSAVAPHSAAAAAVVLVPLAVAALATDAWLEALSGTRQLSRQLSHPSFSQRVSVPMPPWLWLMRPVLLCTVVALLIGLPISQRDVDDLPVQPLRVPKPVVSAKQHATGLSTMLRIGDQVHIERDQQICARLEWNGAAPKTGNMVYLRAITMPEMMVEGPFLLWRAAEDGFLPVSTRLPAQAASGWLLRRPGGGDAVLRPDGARGVGLEHVRRDRDGNWYQPGLGRQTATYRVSLETLTETITGEATVGEIETCRRLPRSLNELPWERVERRAWAAMTPEDAARDIIQVIHQRCRYELDSLPEPEPTPGGALSTFLLSDDADERRGHCQYFSTAAVVLLRRAGHPARTVVGFASEEIDAKGVTFRGLHAHAWLELVDSRGRWQRVDATPSAGYVQRLAGVDPLVGEVAPEVINAHQELDEAAATQLINDDPSSVLGWPLSPRWLARLGVTGGLGLVLYVGIRWWRRRPTAAHRRRQALTQANATLFTCAREMGILVRPSSTLAEVAEALSRRTGVDLAVHVREHQAARYDHGPAPRPWPLAMLRASCDSSTKPGRRH